MTGQKLIFSENWLFKWSCLLFRKGIFRFRSQYKDVFKMVMVMATFRRLLNFKDNFLLLTSRLHKFVHVFCGSGRIHAWNFLSYPSWRRQFIRRTTPGLAQCENLDLFLPFWFYVKSFLADFKRAKTALLTIFESFNFWLDNVTLENIKSTKKFKIQSFFYVQNDSIWGC